MRHELLYLPYTLSTKIKYRRQEQKDNFALHHTSTCASTDPIETQIDLAEDPSNAQQPCSVECGSRTPDML